MKLSKFIEKLQKHLDKNGDKEICMFFSLDEEHYECLDDFKVYNGNSVKESPDDYILYRNQDKEKVKNFNCYVI